MNLVVFAGLGGSECFVVFRAWDFGLERCSANWTSVRTKGAGEQGPLSKTKRFLVER